MTFTRKIKRGLWSWKTRMKGRRFPAWIRHHIRNIAARLAERVSGNGNDIPLERIRHLHIVLSLKCNQRCRMCYQTDYQRDLDPDIVYRKLAPVYPHLEEIILQGGEPTAVAETREFAAFALRINPRIRFSMMTNGVRFDGRWTDFFLRHGKLVNFSLNAARPETYETVSRTNKWPMILENMERLLAGRGSQSEVEVAASFVIIQENFGETAAFIELGRRLGVDRVRFAYDLNLLPRPVGAVRAALDEAVKLTNRAGYPRVEGLERFEAAYFRRQAPAPACSYPFSMLFVDAGGETGLCCQMIRPVGDLHFASVEQIWNGAPARRIRRAFRKGDYRYCGYLCRPIE